MSCSSWSNRRRSCSRFDSEKLNRNASDLRLLPSRQTYDKIKNKHFKYILTCTEKTIPSHNTPAIATTAAKVARIETSLYFLKNIAALVSFAARNPRNEATSPVHPAIIPRP